MSVDLSNLKDIVDLIDNNNNLNSNSEIGLNEKPLLKFKKSILVNSTKADLICIDYSDKLFISITTTGKFGTSLYIRGETLANENIFNVKTIFGEEEPYIEVFGRSLAEKLNKQYSVRKPILVNIGVEKKNLTNIDLLHTFERAILDFYRG